MALLGMIAAPLARISIEYAATRGVARHELYRLLGVSPEQALEHDRWVPLEAMFAVFEVCMRALRDVAFPLEVARFAREEDFHVLGFALTTSRTVREAVTRLARYSGMVTTPGRWSVREEEAAVRVEWLREGPRTLGHRAANECAVAEFLLTLRQLTGLGATPLRVSFRHPSPGDTREHERFFGTRVVFGDTWEGCTLPRELLERVPRAANPALSAYLETQMQVALLARSAGTGIVDRMRVLIAQELASGEPAMPDLARRMSLGERTLRRELSEAGTGFRELVEQVRRERARELLQGGPSSLTEVAFLLGFSEASAFTRAFKRWYGVPPGEFRRAT